ncbi:hypothetical protein DNH61_04155 [Paenibacillus sambharensis]|uniref:Uncharacterized protein n=1 Tax=Paenibacillus sambharensis TaxID=1803190 RepID=A0A2W1LZH2_9BACL|nr:hypothetical protein [Paenibacillus sambharensis]PZD97091.1 hypothetical protein DNH61_04155 [Paenibacillus sambharensis]
MKTKNTEGVKLKVAWRDFNVTKFAYITRFGVVLIAAALMSGCSSNKELSSPSLTTFREEIMEAVPSIKVLAVEAKPTRVVFRYRFDKVHDASLQLNIVKLTDEYMRTPPFDSEVLASYYDEFSKEDRIPPDIALPMDTDDDGEANFEYYASLGQDGEWSWRYSDYKNKHETVMLP